MGACPALECPMNLHIEGKVALVTGASQGIGRAVAAGLAKEGARAVLSSRGEAELHEAVEAIRLSGGEAFGIPADVSEPESIGALLGRVTRRFGARTSSWSTRAGLPPEPRRLWATTPGRAVSSLP